MQPAAPRRPVASQIRVLGPISDGPSGLLKDATRAVTVIIAMVVGLTFLFGFATCSGTTAGRARAGGSARRSGGRSAAAAEADHVGGITADTESPEAAGFSGSGGGRLNRFSRTAR
ncbi:hypothetical protein GCM10010178_39990 [Lentzea flava]|uniref:Uncharacterized protein n=1 Tax=Lentzea flava TaxID=103732 RepID=A0ABQ2UNX2_9PSEU|nr:hypothetical protein GCM10010178_39990 [Lentzea flava]